jgi:phosphohistidine phosphatase
MTHTLILLRHAKSAWPPDTPDADRPLAGRGRRDAPAVGHWLREQNITIDVVVCSPAARTVQTWELVAAQLDAIPRVRYDESLYEACAADLLPIIQEFPLKVSTAVLVGHNPGLEDFLTLLTGVTEPFKTSTIAVMTTPERWQEVRPGLWSLKTLLTPRG